jgi:hypothetical protein
MANKFLPFIVESSTPLNIFKTLVSRSKGMNQLTLAAIFRLILSKPIKELRATVKLFDEMPLEKIYDELLVKYDGYRIENNCVSLLNTMLHWFPANHTSWSEDLNIYEKKDIVTFIVGMILAGRDISEYTNMPFDNLVLQVGGRRERVQSILSNVDDYVHFSDTALNSLFICKREDLVSFVLYKAMFEDDVDPYTSKQKELDYKLIWNTSNSKYYQEFNEADPNFNTGES